MNRRTGLSLSPPEVHHGGMTGASDDRRPGCRAVDDEHVGHGARRRGPGSDDHRGRVDVPPSDAGFARCRRCTSSSTGRSRRTPMWSGSTLVATCRPPDRREPVGVPMLIGGRRLARCSSFARFVVGVDSADVSSTTVVESASTLADAVGASLTLVEILEPPARTSTSLIRPTSTTSVPDWLTRPTTTTPSGRRSRAARSCATSGTGRTRSSCSVTPVGLGDACCAVCSAAPAGPSCSSRLERSVRRNHVTTIDLLRTERRRPYSAATMATATGPSWLIERCHRVTPRSTASSRARAVTCRPRLAGLLDLDPHVVEPERTEPEAERLHHRLAGGEARRQRRARGRPCDRRIRARRS